MASRGIAVLRYTKRNKAYPNRMKEVVKSITVKAEVIEDAVIAVQLLTKYPSIDAKRIFVLGHSIGGILAPSLALASKKVAGLISTAGSTRTLEELILEQITYILSLNHSLSKSDKKKRLCTLEESTKRTNKRLFCGIPFSESPFPQRKRTQQTWRVSDTGSCISQGYPRYRLLDL